MADKSQSQKSRLANLLGTVEQKVIDRAKALLSSSISEEKKDKVRAMLQDFLKKMEAWKSRARGDAMDDEAELEYHRIIEQLKELVRRLLGESVADTISEAQQRLNEHFQALEALLGGPIDREALLQDLANLDAFTEIANSNPQIQRLSQTHNWNQRTRNCAAVAQKHWQVVHGDQEIPDTVLVDMTERMSDMGYGFVEGDQEQQVDEVEDGQMVGAEGDWSTGPTEEDKPVSGFDDQVEGAEGGLDAASDVDLAAAADDDSVSGLDDPGDEELDGEDDGDDWGDDDLLSLDDTEIDDEELDEALRQDSGMDKVAFQSAHKGVGGPASKRIQGASEDQGDISHKNS